MVSLDAMNKLSEWLNAELRARGWSMRELGRQISFSPSLVSEVINERVPASADFCIAVARVFNEPPEKILRLGGHLPPRPKDDPFREALNSLWDLAPEETKKQVMLLIRAAVEEHEREQAEREARRRMGERVEEE